MTQLLATRFRLSLRRCWPVAAFVSILSATPPAWSQSGDPAAARVLFNEAQKLAAAGDYGNACPKFADSYRLDPAVGTLLNIADCEERVGHLTSAWVSFQKALDQLPVTDERRAPVAEVASRLEKRLSRLTLSLAASTPADLSIERDGVPVVLGSLGVMLPVDPGQHSVLVKARGFLERRYQFDLGEGETKSLTIEPGPAEPPRPVPPVAPPSTETMTALRSENQPSATVAVQAHPSRLAAPAVMVQPSPPSEARDTTAAYAVGGVGAAAIVVGIVTRALAFGQKSTINAHCDAEKSCDSTGMDAVSRAGLYQTVSSVSLIVGALGLGGGIYLGLAEPEKPATAATLRPVVLPNGAVLSLQRSF